MLPEDGATEEEIFVFPEDDCAADVVDVENNDRRSIPF